MLKKILVGADIEVFLKDKVSGEIVSAENIIKGSKYEPFFFKQGNKFFATSLDNIMAEFCIPPSKTAKQFVENIQEAMDYIASTIPKELEIAAIPSARVNEKWLQTENAMLFGCEPDYNAWMHGHMNERPTTIMNLRSCGGHIHIGYNDPSPMKTLNLIKAMDIFVGLPSVIMEPNNERKQLYGKAGCFRFKKYGGEYRTISNYYVSDPRLMEYMYNNTILATEFASREKELTKEEEIAIQAAINLANSELAQTLCTHFGIELVALK